MILPDVSVLVYAFRREADRHGRYKIWLTELVHGTEELALTDVVLAGFARIVTHPRIMAEPAPFSIALEFLSRLRQAPRARWVASSPSCWERLQSLATHDRAIAGNLVPDAYLAALAISHGARLATADRGFARFAGLRFFDPAG